MTGKGLESDKNAQGSTIGSVGNENVHACVRSI